MTDTNYSCKTVAHSINYISDLKHFAVFIPVSAFDLLFVNDFLYNNSTDLYTTFCNHFKHLKIDK